MSDKHIIFRIENKAGNGPYNYHDLAKAGFDVGETNGHHPSPSGVMRMHSCNYYGFQALPLLFRWFNRIEISNGPISLEIWDEHRMTALEYLEANGFHIAVYMANEDDCMFCPSGLQCAFVKENATLLKTMAISEAESLLESEAA